MIRRQKLHALVLARKNFGEADRVVTLFTRQHGMLRVMAKNVRRIPSRRGAYLEPLSHVLCLVSGSQGRYFLSAVEPVDDFSALRQQSAALRAASVITQVLLGLFEEEESQPELFDAVHHAWSVLPQVTDAKQNILEVALLLYALERAGVGPDLTQCQICHTAQPKDAVVLHPADGGWRCLSCHDSFVGTEASLSPRLLKAMKWLSQYPRRALSLAMDESESVQLATSLRRYVTYAIEAPIYVNLGTVNK